MGPLLRTKLIDKQQRVQIRPNPSELVVKHHEQQNENIYCRWMTC